MSAIPPATAFRAVVLAALFSASAHSCLPAQTKASEVGAPRITLKLADRSIQDAVAIIRNKVGVRIIMDEELDWRVTIDLKDVAWRIALELVVEKAGYVLITKGSGLLKIEKPPYVYRLGLGEPIQKVIDDIAKRASIKIEIAPEVQGAIRPPRRNVPWRDGLEYVCKTLGYEVIEKENGVLRVVPRSNLRDDVVTKSFQLRFVRPPSTYLPIINSQYVRDIATPSPAPEFELVGALRRVLTPDLGSLEYFAARNLIVVKDIKPVIDQIRSILDQIDVEPPRVLLDVQSFTISNLESLDHGPAIGNRGWWTHADKIPTCLPFDLGLGGFEDDLIDDLIACDRGFVLDGNAGTTTIPSVMPGGALNFQEVTAALLLLKQYGVQPEIMQAPKLIALDHQESTFFVGATLQHLQTRYEQNETGRLLVVEEPPKSTVDGFELAIVPHVVPGTDKIIMDVVVKPSVFCAVGSTDLAPPGFGVFAVGSGSGDDPVASATSTYATRVLVRSGQSIRLEHTSTNKTRTVLAVFITPRLVPSAAGFDENVHRMMREREEMIEAERRAIYGGKR